VNRCLDENDLAALAEGRLLEAARPAVDGHLRECGRCRELATALVAAAAVDAADGAASGHPRPSGAGAPWGLPLPPGEGRGEGGSAARTLRTLASVAAALLVAGIAALPWLLDPGTRPAGPPAFAGPGGFDSPAARAVRAELPSLEALLAVPLPPVTRGAPGDLAALSPRGKVLDTRPGLRWRADGLAPGPARVLVLALDPRDLRATPVARFEAEATAGSAPLPPAVLLERGRPYAWRVEATAEDGGTARSPEVRFSLATAAEMGRVHDLTARVAGKLDQPTTLAVDALAFFRAGLDEAALARAATALELAAHPASRAGPGVRLHAAAVARAAAARLGLGEEASRYDALVRELSGKAPRR